MAIQQLDVHGYRSFRDISWKPSNLNLIVGPNGSGKSNLLRLFELISETAKGRLANAMKPPQGGGIIPLLWDYQNPSLDWKIRIDPVDTGRDPTSDALTLEFRLDHIRNTSSYRIALDSLGNWFKFDQGLETSPLWIYRRDLGQAIFYHQGQSRLVRLEDVDANESLLPQISDPTINPIPAHTIQTSRRESEVFLLKEPSTQLLMSGARASAVLP